MTEEFWQKWKSGRDERHPNMMWKQMERGMRDQAIKEKHPDELYAICRTDNNYLRHYRASTKLSIDELSMFICRDVGCDLMYCQHLVGKPRNNSQQITSCTNQFNNFRDCVVREKKVFRDLVS